MQSQGLISGQLNGIAAPRARASRRSLVMAKLKAKPSPSRVDSAEKKPNLFQLWNGKTTEEKADSKAGKKMPVPGTSGLGSFISALDFAEVRSKSDAALLYEAKYGKLNNGKMSREQYQALRRKVGGTARDFWKTSIDVKGEYTDKGYVSEEATVVPGLQFLIATVVALFGTSLFVILNTTGN